MVGLSEGRITPNQFKGSDTERIQAAVYAGKSQGKPVVVPAWNSNGTKLWQIDKAILLPGEITLMLENCTLQLSDSARDNMFRSENVGVNIGRPDWLKNIHIIGIGNVVLKGARNPRATGDGYRKLVLDPTAAREAGEWRVSYGSDAGKVGRKQTGDWRNIMILIAYVQGVRLENIKIENSHAWAVSFERTHNAEVADLRIYNPEDIEVDGKKIRVYNKDGLNLRHGCKNFMIRNISGINGDDLVALSSLDVDPGFHRNGDINSYQVTSTKWAGPEDDTEQIFIRNCATNYTGVAIRASAGASIHHIYIDGIVTSARSDIPPPYGGSPYSLLVGGKGYGDVSQKGKINHVYAMNLIGDGKNLILVEAPIANCSFSSGLYKGPAKDAISFNIDKTLLENVNYTNLLKVD
jgi:polygalacturonase